MQISSAFQIHIFKLSTFTSRSAENTGYGHTQGVIRFADGASAGQLQVQIAFGADAGEQPLRMFAAAIAFQACAMTSRLSASKPSIHQINFSLCQLSIMRQEHPGPRCAHGSTVE
jgi:hypothetical protein